MSLHLKQSADMLVNEDNNENDDDNDEDDDEEEETYRDPPEGFVRLRPSMFRNLPSTVFFEYPPELALKRMDASVLEPLEHRKLGYDCYWMRNCIKNAFLRAGFEKSEKNWTINWTKHQNQSQLRAMNCLQKVNHYPSSWCIGRKDRLSRTLTVMKRYIRYY
jgi:tubulin polyglutamylase TTLL4